MECISIDLDSSLIADSEIVQVDFLQEIQQNISKFQTQLETLIGKVSYLEKVSTSHQRQCICMNKLDHHVSPSSSGPSSSTASGSHPEIHRIDSRVTFLDKKLEQVKYDLKQLSQMVSMQNSFANFSNANSSPATVPPPPTTSASSSQSAGPAILQHNSGKVHNQRKSVHQLLQQDEQEIAPLPPRPPPPLTRISSIATTPTRYSAAPTTATSVAGRINRPLTSTSSSSVNIQENHHSIDDADQENDGEDLHPQRADSNSNGSQTILDEEDEHEQEEAEVTDLNEDEDDEIDPLINIAPEVIFDDGGEDDEDDIDTNTDLNFSSFDPEPELDDNYDDEGQGQGFVRNRVVIPADNDTFELEVEFRDKLGNIIQCLGSELSGKMQCPTCHVQCTSRRNIIRHYNNKHADPKSYQCTICSAVLNRKDSLAVHLKHRHGVVEQGGNLVEVPIEIKATVIQYTCNACGKSFSRPDSLTAHKCSAAAVPSAVAVITRPPPRLTRQNGLPTVAHPLPPPLTNFKRMAPASAIPPISRNVRKCPLCPKTFTMRQYLLRHLKSHTQDNQCHTCGNNYSRRDKLKAHLRSKHGIELGSSRSRSAGGGSGSGSSRGGAGFVGHEQIGQDEAADDDDYEDDVDVNGDTYIIDLDMERG